MFNTAAALFLHCSKPMQRNLILMCTVWCKSECLSLRSCNCKIHNKTWNCQICRSFYCQCPGTVPLVTCKVVLMGQHIVHFIRFLFIMAVHLNMLIYVVELLFELTMRENVYEFQIIHIEQSTKSCQGHNDAKLFSWICWERRKRVFEEQSEPTTQFQDAALEKYTPWIPVMAACWMDACKTALQLNPSNPF